MLFCFLQNACGKGCRCTSMCVVRGFCYWVCVVCLYGSFLGRKVCIYIFALTCPLHALLLPWKLSRKPAEKAADAHEGTNGSICVVRGFCYCIGICSVPLWQFPRKESVYSHFCTHVSSARAASPLEAELEACGKGCRCT